MRPKIIPEWRQQLEVQLAAAKIVVEETSRRVIPAATATLVARARAVLAERQAQINELLSHTRAVTKVLTTFEEHVVKALRGGAVVSSASEYQLAAHDRPKRQQWSTEGVQRLVEHLAAEVAAQTGKELPELFSYERLFQLAVEQEWIGGTCAELEVTAKLTAVTQPTVRSYAPKLTLTRIS